MTTKHTPGPWRAVVRGNQTGITEVAVCIDKANGGTWRPNVRRLTTENAADARLIAAAPELLAALRNLLYVIDSEQLEDYLADDQKLVAKAAHAALAKAEA